MSDAQSDQKDYKLYRVSNLSPLECGQLADKFAQACRNYCAHDHAGIFQMTPQESVELQAQYPEAQVQILTR